jgi:hypothetical protein
MEFNAIQTVWNAFVKAWLSTNGCLLRMITIPPFDKMSDDDVRKLATSSGFSDEDQERLLNASDRQEEYVRTVKWREVIRAGNDIYQARLTLREQRIFMPPDLTKHFGDKIERMSSVQVEQRISIEHRMGWDRLSDSNAWIQDNVTVFDDMAIRANQRLFRDELNATRN